MQQSRGCCGERSSASQVLSGEGQSGDGIITAKHSPAASYQLQLLACWAGTLAHDGAAPFNSITTNRAWAQCVCKVARSDAVQAGCCMAPDRYHLRDNLLNGVCLQTRTLAVWRAAWLCVCVVLQVVEGSC
jgi:hypothetical protein